MDNSVGEIHFLHEPTFAELWEACVNRLYSEKEYCDDIERLFEKLGISKSARILDVAAGSGFPALGLAERGYLLESSDGFVDEVDLFNQRASERGLAVSCEKISWSELSEHFKPASYDFIFCRGNSFIYALGGWNTEISVSPESALQEYENTARIFLKLLKPEGVLYIDKFKDTETTHRETVARIKVENSEPEDLVFWTERMPDRKLRRASMIRKTQDGAETSIPNISYDLTAPEMKESLLRAGFSSVDSISLPSEKLFDTWIVRV